MAEVITISGPGWGAFGASCPPGFTTTPGGNCKGSKGGALQSALRSLGSRVGDSSLAGLTVDGSIGPATAAAVNRAFTTYVQGAPAAFRTGALTIYDVAQNVDALASLLQGEIVRRAGSGAVPARVTYDPGTGSNTLWWVLGGLGALAVAGGVAYVMFSGGRRSSRRRYAYA